MSASVVVDFFREPEFQNRFGCERPRVELIREQLANYVDGYQLAKNHQPPRIVLQAGDFNHCLRRILARMQKPHRDRAKADWKERRKAGSQELWRDAKPNPLTDAALTWAGIPIESVGYSRHRAVDKH